MIGRAKLILFISAAAVAAVLASCQTLPPVLAEATPPRAPVLAEAMLPRALVAQQQASLRLIHSMLSADPDPNVLMRRPKFLTDGSYDTADPSVPIRVPLASSSVWMMLFSGGSVIYDSSPDGFLKGGLRPLHSINFEYADGGVMTVRPYREKAAPWDPDLSYFTKTKVDTLARSSGHAAGTQPEAAPRKSWIGFAGVMKKRVDGTEPTRAQDNWTRSRHAFDVQVSPGVGDEPVHQQWRDLGPIHGDKPHQFEGQWISPAHAHGYGSHYIEDDNHVPYLFYERVSDQRYVGGGLIPYRTEIFAQRLNGDRTRAIGVETKILASAPATHPSRPYLAAQRSGDSGELVEGPHLIEALVNKVSFISCFSAPAMHIQIVTAVFMRIEKSQTA